MTTLTRAFLLLALAAPVAGCDLLNTPPEEELGPDGDDARPHVIVIAASGHPLTATTGLHEADLITRGTATALHQVLSSDGSVVWVWDHADEFYNFDDAGNVLTPWDNADHTTFGFLQLTEDLRFVRDNWIDGKEVPTRVVVLAHSHGVVWAHIAAHMYPGLPIDILIDLDGDSTSWDGEGITGLPSDHWDQVIVDWTNATSTQWPFDIWAVRDSWPVEGSAVLHDIEDLVPASVTLNLEVQGSGQLLFDADPNVRADGSFEGVETFLSTSGHDEVADPYSDSMEWVLTRTAEFYGLL